MMPRRYIKKIWLKRQVCDNVFHVNSLYDASSLLSYEIEEIADRIFSLGNDLGNYPYHHVQTILKIAWKNVQKFSLMFLKVTPPPTQSFHASWQFDGNVITPFSSNITNR